MTTKYLAMAILLTLAPVAHAMDCADAAKEYPFQIQKIAEDTAQLNAAEAQYRQLRAKTNNLMMQLRAIEQEQAIHQGFASQLQLLMQALDALKGDFSRGKVEEVAQALQQFPGFEAAVAPIRDLFDHAIRQASVREQQGALGSAMDKLGQVIETQSANLLALEKARRQMDDLSQESSREDDKLFKITGEMGANIIRRETTRDDAQNVLQNCPGPEEREPIGGLGRF
jgi:hypothetical protein